MIDTIKKQLVKANETIRTLRSEKRKLSRDNLALKQTMRGLQEMNGQHELKERMEENRFGRAS